MIEPFKTRGEAKHSLFYYIDYFYNRIRQTFGTQLFGAG
ncbi:MAG: hypothetical protein H6628_03325 [Calditrichae bacterium]|nr:hypothetical protein [Calditrichia bacterium]